MTAAVTVATAAVVFAIARRSLAYGLVPTLLALVAANGSVTWLKEPFLTARWGAFGALAAVAFLHLTRLRRPVAADAVPAAALAFAALSTAWSIDSWLTAQRAVTFGVLLFVVYALTRGAGDPAGDRERIVRAGAAASACVAIASVLVWIVEPSRGVQFDEVRGVFESPNGLGLFLALTYPFVLATVEPRARGRPWTALVVLPFAVLVMLSLSRSGLLALVAGISAYELVRRHWGRWGVHAIAVAAVVALFTVWHPLPPPPPGAFGDPRTSVGARTGLFGGDLALGTTRLDAILGGRLEAWAATNTLVSERPLAGFGFGTGDRVFARRPDVATFRYFQGANPNNGYLHTLLELGVAGALLVFGALVLSLAGALRLARAGPRGRGRRRLRGRARRRAGGCRRREPVHLGRRAVGAADLARRGWTAPVRAGPRPRGRGGRRRRRARSGAAGPAGRS